MNRILSLFAVAASLLILAACGQKTNCSGISFGSTGGSGSGAGGGTNAGGSTCGSGGGGGNPSAVDYLYSVNGTSIDGAYFNGTSLQAIVGFAQPNLGNGATADTFIVGGKFLYQPWAPSSGGSEIFAFAIDHSGGGLTPISGSPFTTSAVADAIATDPNGKFLFMGQSASHTISVMAINATTGALTPVSGSPFLLSDLAEQVVVDGTGKYLYAVLAHGGGVVEGFSIDTTGALTPLPASPFILGTSRLAPHPSGKFLIGLGSAVLVTVPIDTTTGNLSVGAAISPTTAPEQVLMHPTGNFVYTFAFPVAAIEGFAVDASGNLTPLTNSPFASAAFINNAKIDGAGTTMVGLTSAGSFQAVVVDPKTGTLTSPGAPYSGTASTFFGLTN